MAKVLYITANPKPTSASFSSQAGEAFLTEYKANNPQDEVTILDIYKEEIPYIDEDVLSSWGKGAQGIELTADEAAKAKRMSELVDQFVDADKYVFVTPLWNLSLPARLKAYIDTVSIAGKTFRYTATGPEGLLKGKKALHIQARGGMYSEGPAKELEFGDRYLRAITAFMGIEDYQHIAMEGHSALPDQADAILQKGLAEAKEAATKF
ncbi:FMN-dependent NADH-azoreductase [Croceifilum oryzae]|uniref:FMN dependent NADH:quinone oxidoreductase n=1 Tax=Croceifilum oryzae TaxID=1553429 RepID=A0AAJ1TFJ3_9BACL|nr:FMN-dependent NADH-azoreductase [Croceifilum oryzae]MDQ0417504.1 FMN-dependent NADH-azoreductase [Croceifilum oryzae]